VVAFVAPVCRATTVHVKRTEEEMKEQTAIDPCWVQKPFCEAKCGRYVPGIRKEEEF
jgi:hypothetical protein